ncbi:MAG: phosphopyruvate hydratase [Candidatus Ranarchaeia archaeon]|jgi:enolase
MSKDLIDRIHAREVIDSRGNPTVEVDVISQSGLLGRAIVPSGASTGTHEALELRDGDKTRFHGKGVLKAVNNINTHIRSIIYNQDPTNWKEIDKILIKADGTPNKAKLGANAILGVSLANAHLAALIRNQPLFQFLGESKSKWVLPVPFMNILNGGEHAGNDLAIQEFMVAPIGASSFSEGLQWVSEIYITLKSILIKKYGKTAKNVGDEGGFAPPMKSTKEALDCIIQAVEENGRKIDHEIAIALDAAANEFFKGEKYAIDGKMLTATELNDFYIDLVKSYPIISIEDPYNEDQFDDFAMLNRAILGQSQVVGDDLTVTNPTRIKVALDKQSMSALLLKVNQIGSLSEAINSAKLCFDNKVNVMVSHRSGETEDVTIADLVVALGSGQLKSGAPCRGERTAKFNRLLRIEEMLNENALYAGKNYKTPWKLW